MFAVPSSTQEQVSWGSLIASMCAATTFYAGHESENLIGLVVALVFVFVGVFLAVFLFQFLMTKNYRGPIQLDERDQLIEWKSYKLGYAVLLLPLILWFVEAGRRLVGGSLPTVFDFTDPKQCIVVIISALLGVEIVRNLYAIILYRRG